MRKEKRKIQEGSEHERAREEPKQPRARVGFLSFRIHGTDGVSLETDKWAQVFEREGCRTCFFAGELDTPKERSYVSEMAHFKHPDILAIQRKSFGVQKREPELTKRIHELKNGIKEELHAFLDRFSPDLLVVENVLSLPLNIPFAIAVTEILSETCIPAIGHHHDFFWERLRFKVGCVWDYINMAYPPNLPNIQHVVINSSAAHQLALRTGVTSLIIPNVIDFDTPPDPPDEYASDVRNAFGIPEDQRFFLQPTRVVARKGIEQSIELVHRLEEEACLVISHASGDEEREYEKRVRTYSEMLGVNTLFVSGRMNDHRGRDSEGRKVYALSDVYPHADLVTYPSHTEGFGNAFLESVYFRKPIVVNVYSVYAIDIKPKGFRAIELQQYVTEDTVRQTREILANEDLRQEMVETNYELARRHYSYGILADKLKSLMAQALGR